MASTIWKGHLTFGLISIPVKLVRAARAEKIHMHNLHRETGSRVKQVFVPAETSPVQEEPEPELPLSASFRESLEAAAKRPPAKEHRLVEVPAPVSPSRMEELPPERGISRSDLVRGFEYEKDRYVHFEKDELEQIAPKTSPDMQIVEFVHFADVDPVYLESSYYVAAEKAGAKPYALLYEALKKTGYAAIAEFVMHRRDQTMILRPGRQGIIGHTLFYEDEVKRDNEYHADPALIIEREMDLAIKFVEALAVPFEPEKFKDKYRERLQQAISEKLATGAVEQPRQPRAGKPVLDIMAALEESLKRAKKPVVSEGSTTRTSGRKKRSGGN